MITPKQLFRHGFITAPASTDSHFFMHGKVNGVLSGGVFHFPMVNEWIQCKNLSHLKYEYKKATGEKLEAMEDSKWEILKGLIN